MYSEQDKLEMSRRQARVDIGQGIGNACQIAKDITFLVFNNPVKGRTFNQDEILNMVFEIRDSIFASNSAKIDMEHKKWMSEHLPVEEPEKPKWTPPQKAAYKSQSEQLN